jgi:hypothetical protein
VIALSLCVNDENGNITDECSAISIEIDGDTAFFIEGEISFLEIPDNVIQIDNLCMEWTARGTMVGSVFWNAYRVALDDAVLLANMLKDNEFVMLTEAWSPLYDKWDSAEKFTDEDFKGEVADGRSIIG